MRIGIVNDMLMAREALRRAVASVPGPRGRLAGPRRRRGGREGPLRPARPDPDGPDHAGRRRRRGDPADHGAVPLRDRDRHQLGQRPPRQGLRGDGPGGPRRGRHPGARPVRRRGRGPADARQDRHRRQAPRPVAPGGPGLGRPAGAAAAGRPVGSRPGRWWRSAARPAARRRWPRSSPGLPHTRDAVGGDRPAR